MLNMPNTREEPAGSMQPCKDEPEMEHHTKKLAETHPFATPRRRETMHRLPGTPLRTKALRLRRAAYKLARTSWRNARVRWIRWTRKQRLNDRFPNPRGL
jgi:hypothetical protein